jgi:hypothetical protein
MKISSKRIVGLVLGWGPGLLLGLNWATHARASYIELEFSTGQLFRQHAPPFHLDEFANLDGAGSGHGVVDLRSGQMKGQITTVPQPAWSN